MLTNACSLVVGFGLGLDIESGYAHVFVPLSVDSVTVPLLRCDSAEMICEPSHLKRLNAAPYLEEFMRSRSLSTGTADAARCASVDAKDDVYYPAFEPATKRCFLQKDALLFSCVGGVDGLVRLCSCRDYIRGQTALCSQCL